VIHQILILKDYSSEVEHFTKQNEKHFKKMYPMEDYKLWLNSEIEKFIKLNFDESVFYSYVKLQPYAYKADLARYCILYILGGWYFDFFTLPLFGYKPEKSTLLFRDFYISEAAPWALNNAVVYTEAKNTIFLRCIQEIVMNCRLDFYGASSLFVSGPPLLGSAVSVDFRNFHHYEIGEFTKKEGENRFSFYLSNRDKLALHKDSEGGVFNLPGSNNYGEMWKNREVYDLSIKI
jgi:mannosyltransferase OCH1-like enzyme